MADGEFQLHGTRIWDGVPTVDQEIDAPPESYQTSLGQEALRFFIIDYNLMKVGETRISLGELATRMLNSFFIVDPHRVGSIPPINILKIWQEYEIPMKSRTRTGPVLRGVEALNAIREQIDGLPFVTGGSKGTGRPAFLSIAEDIAIVDTRFD